MPRSRSAFRQSEIERMLRAAKAAGFSSPTVRRNVDGSLDLLTDGAAKVELSPLERWEKRHGHG